MTVSAVATYDNANVGTGKTITVVYTLDGADAAKYAAPTNTVVTTGVITKATTPAAPATIFSFDGANANAGKLMGATTAMEYSLDGGSNWIPVETNDPALPVASINDTDDIKVRVKASSNTEEGAIQTIDITKATKPSLTGNIASAFGGIPGTAYLISYNGTKWDDAWADADGKISISKGTWSVKVKSTGTVLESDVQTNVVSS
ncbi:hypothetical protein CH76_10285 [Lysinibacillus sp. BF-4]|nr:hypothetical protein CH76_10285 [Lysinibacillus sp. BF-4]